MSEDRSRDPGEMLQAAVLEFVNGARAVLDVVEELATDPSRVARVVDSTVGAMRNAAEAAGYPGTSSREAREEPTAHTSRVTRIRVQ